MKKQDKQQDTPPEHTSPSLAVKAGDVIRLDRSGIRACGDFRAGVDYTVGEGKGQVSPERAHRLVTVKGFRVNPPAKASSTTKKE
ncbi:hypothetical protein [Natronospira bacteriovora]|uniref:50S ribosomal protein L27 n=1 Tax=Natronospira bacteriovora TaxID=3069753 RepID=A0ABU0W5K9_9GAMM|nr:hypothetical protein [Natronospira sp. AB-CW4]MDQ2069318.1 hypothetical protein [Natronospira sp. AB-CW4]